MEELMIKVGLALGKYYGTDQGIEIFKELCLIMKGLKNGTTK